jgi:hypothetical protein
MSAVFILLALSVAIGFALSAFTWWTIVASVVMLAVFSATVLQIEGFGTIPGIAIVTACLTTSELAYLIGHVEKRFAQCCREKPAETKGSFPVLLTRKSTPG